MTIINESWYVRPPGALVRPGAGGLVCRWDGARWVFAATEEHGLAHVVLPKGGIDPGEDAEEAARREVAEETGLDELRLLGELGEVARLGFDKLHWKPMRFFVYVTTQTDGVPSDEDKDLSLRWLPLDDFPDLFWPEQNTLIRDNLPRIYAMLSDSKPA